MQKGPGSQAAAVKALVDDDGADDTLGTDGADPIVDLADHLADVDEKQALLAGAGQIGEVRGQELDRPVGEDPAAEATGAPASA
ncbi:hypothetical protein [Streptomyces sp. Qhu_M48]|uniref:hypothetical protein n=1 Tax=Streptomyces sp. Qhu_M48 TaxID=3435889 RepID=UPI003F5030CD